MKPFQLTHATAVEAALALHTQKSTAYIAGGTTLLDLMKDDVLHPDLLVDISRLPLRDIEVTATGVRIGALATMNEVAQSPVIRERYPVVSEALLASASQQLRNMA